MGTPSGGSGSSANGSRGGVGAYYRAILLGSDLDATGAGPNQPLHLHHDVPGGLGPRKAPARPHPGRAEYRVDADQIIEVFGHITLYAGTPFAPGAMDIANEIFTSA